MLAPVVGELISEMAAGRKPHMDVSGLDLGRFERGELNVEPSVV
jgi:glycine/D-amino acid oxidase-like deaminating enzyme